MNPLELLARTGFLVKGLLYTVIGVLALQVATGLGGRVTGTRGALMTVLGQPFGRTLLLIAAISLLSQSSGTSEGFHAECSLNARGRKVESTVQNCEINRYQFVGAERKATKRRLVSVLVVLCQGSSLTHGQVKTAILPRSVPSTPSLEHVAEVEGEGASGYIPPDAPAPR